jgi:hypothetical protein
VEAALKFKFELEFPNFFVGVRRVPAGNGAKRTPCKAELQPHPSLEGAPLKFFTVPHSAAAAIRSRSFHQQSTLSAL